MSSSKLTKQPAARGRGPRSTREALRQRGPTRRQISRRQREQRRLGVIILGAVALLVISAGILGFGYWRENIAKGQETVAVVFGERVTADAMIEQTRPRLTLLDQRMNLLRANNLTQQATQLQLQRQRLPELVLNSLIEDRVVEREASRRGLQVKPEEIEAQIRQTVSETEAANQPQPTPTATRPEASPATAAGTPTMRPTATPVPTLTDDRYGPARQAYLNQTGLGESQLVSSIRSELLEQKLREAIGAEVPAVQEQVYARRAVYKSEAEATAVFQQLQSGTAFEEVAAGQAPDQTSSSQGSDPAWLPRLGRDPAFDQALFSLQAGQANVVQSARGWEIVQVLERDPARPVEETLLDEMRRRHYGDWLAAAQGSPEIQRSLTPEISNWILQRAGQRR
jgi:parvulin-like peptidyl-prolyl isomerase